MKKYILFLAMLGVSFLAASNEVIEERQAEIKKFNAFANKNKKEKDIAKKFSDNPFLMYYMSNIYKKGKSEREEFFKKPFTEKELEEQQLIEEKRLIEEKKRIHENSIRKEEGLKERKRWEETVDSSKISVKEKIKEFNKKVESNYDQDYVKKYRKFLLEQAELLKVQKEFIEKNESLIKERLKGLDEQNISNNKDPYESKDSYDEEEKTRVKRGREKMERLRNFNEESRMRGW